MIRQALQQIEQDLPASYYRELPEGSDSRSHARPRVFAVVETALDQSGLPVDGDALSRFCRAYRSDSHDQRRLTIGELWAIPTVLRITLLECLCHAAELRQQAAGQEAKNDLTDSTDLETERIAGCITSLRTVATLDWVEFVERTGAVDATLSRDPSGHYRGMEFSSRDRYRDVVEEIARRCTAQQWEVAQSAVELARRSVREDAPAYHRHVGYYLIDKGRPQLERALGYRPSLVMALNRHLRRHAEWSYLLAVNGLAVLGTWALMSALLAINAHPALALLTGIIVWIPLVSVSSDAVNFLVSLLVPPARLPKLDFHAGIPAQHRTIVVVPMLLSTAEEIADNLATLEQNYLGNSDPRLIFALLSDFTDAQAAEAPEDEKLLSIAIDGIDSLNRRYEDHGSGPFLLFHRQRKWSENEQCWMGWERKRGKLEEFMELLRGSTDTSYVLQHGGHTVDLRQLQFVITLDADTYMGPGTAQRLVGTLAHPLNRPVFDQSTGRVKRGYTVVQPRLEINPVSVDDTWFARIFAGDVTLDLYSHAVSNVYQDLFGEAVFAGKGILDVIAFRRALAGQVPEDTVLSHDLLEGLMGRAALASDITFLEDYPSNYLVYLKRMHRWIRGDWQLFRWLLGRGYSADRTFKPGVIGRWKLFDNLRRSLFTPAILLLLLLGWLVLPGNPVVWTAVFALFPGLPILLRLTSALRTSHWRWGTIESSLRNLGGHAGADLARWVLTLVFLPTHSQVTMDAVARTLYRVLISRRRLLEWSTAATVTRALASVSTRFGYWIKLWFAPATAGLTTLAVIGFNPPALLPASALLVSWFLAPLIALRLGQVIEGTLPARMTPDEEAFLRGIARDTWRFFERFVNADTNWLPPDNVQDFPQTVIAERTSPTNIGMMLLAALSAYDMGYLGQRQLLRRMESHLDAVQRMPKYRGHLFNWYSLRDLRPLEPQYVSTVDSGNMLAALIVTRQALAALPVNPAPTLNSVVALIDELEVLRLSLFDPEGSEGERTFSEVVKAIRSAQAHLANGENLWLTATRFAEPHCSRIEQAMLNALRENPDRQDAQTIGSFRETSQELRQRTRILLEDLALFAPWTELFSAPPGVFQGNEFHHSYNALADFLEQRPDGMDIQSWHDEAGRRIENLFTQVDRSKSAADVQAALGWLEQLRAGIDKAAAEMRAFHSSRLTLIEASGGLIRETDFGFLYDSSRHLFRVGYNVSTAQPDSSFYDLLASEARIASFVAIAKGDAPAKHWVHLGRPLTRIRGLRILLSWSATAFEYLMPRLIMRSPSSGLINQSCAAAVKAQIRFGRKNDIPWGISESGYAQLDSHGNYQYYAFGIPKLGLKWDQGERLVVSSYASVLALPYAPREVIANLRRLSALGAYAHYGLYEAVDFGEAQRERPEGPRIVKSYMAHHQGMILVSIGNAVTQDEMVRRFHRDPRIASIEHLLYERLPSRIQTRPLERLPSLLKESSREAPFISDWKVERDQAEIAVFSNGRLSSRLSDRGGGTLRWHGKSVTRWGMLGSGPAAGTRIYLQDRDTSRYWRLGQIRSSLDASAHFSPHTAEFRMRGEEMMVRAVITVAPVSDVEVRDVTVVNESSRVRRIMLTSYGEPVLGDDAADRRHPAFSKLFVESSFHQESGALVFRRRPLEPGQQPMFLAHAAVSYPEFEVERGFEVDRRAFMGRVGNAGGPAALTDPAYHFKRPEMPGDIGDASLDACAVISVTLEIPPGATAHCAFLYAVADSQAAAIDALIPYQSPQRIGWAVDAARLQVERELTLLRMDFHDVRDAFRLLAEVYWPPHVSHVGDHAFFDLNCVQADVWRQGISGDRAIITVRVRGERDLPMVESVLKSVGYLERKDILLDAILLDETEGGYGQPLNQSLARLTQKHVTTERSGRHSSAYIVPVRNLREHEKQSLIASARILFGSERASRDSPFSARAQSRGSMPAFVPQPSSPLSDEVTEPIAPREDLVLTNPLGGMLPGRDGYSVLISKASRTPAPWCNILANSEFGALVSESGSMCTWWQNSSENRLTPWGNDAVLDPTGEAIYVRDEETGSYWSMTPQPSPADAPYRVTHGIGESTFEHNSHGLLQHLRVFVDSTEPVKIMTIRMTNVWPRARRLTVTFAVEWLLGNYHQHHRHLLTPARDDQTEALLIRNRFSRATGEACAFVTSDLKAHGVTCDGNEFFGSRWSWADPPGLSRIGLSGYTGPATRPCAIYQVHIDLQPEETKEFHFALGAGQNQQSVQSLATRLTDPQWPGERHRSAVERWNRLLSRWEIETPDIALDAMLNKWLLYQVFASRLWGRTGFYQSSGGFGFRDQLQDILAVLDASPDTARKHIIRAASRQFEEGDVLHWWHESPLRGVRTRIADDLLWLPFAVAEYCEHTEDFSLLSETVPFLRAEPLATDELERYAEYEAGSSTATVYAHCCRAIDARLSFGRHGMPYFGTGDWNDGLNRVGAEGEGESVWMAWFLVAVCRGFAGICEHMTDQERADEYRRIATDLQRQAQQEAWAGSWFIRGYFDDGTALGAPGNREMEIDLNAQTWAVLIDPGHPRSIQCMRSAEEKLFDADHRLIKLLAPPFDTSSPHPGYIEAYPPGVRENGGQYTHAAVWAAWAAVESGDSEKAIRWFRWLNPLQRADSAEDIERYRLEPFVMPGDIYGSGALTGRGGWSWYTGSAAWMYRLGMHKLLGLQRRGERLFIRPCLPDSWPQFRATFRYRDAEHCLHVHEPGKLQRDELFMLHNDRQVDAACIDLECEGRHEYRIFASADARADWMQEEGS